MTTKKRVCIIGAGMAGLTALKNTLEHDLDAIAYERHTAIGGTWIYMERKEGDSEEDVFSSMYYGLLTNLPKELMGFPDYDFDTSIEDSFISSELVLQYLHDYASHFKLAPHIKFEHEIMRVRPRKNCWEVIVHDLKSDMFLVELFDFVLICNGHFSMPFYPNTKGLNQYRGQRLHSHLYRKPDVLKDHTVLVVGGGPSGIDIVHHIYQHAKHIYLSHHLEAAPRTDFMPNVTQKPDVERFTKDGAVFKDGSSASFSYVIFCTGYKFTFPFLSVDCGLNVDFNYVYPLYKHCLNINKSSMAIIGLPHQVCPAQLFDLQVRFVLTYFTGRKKMPSESEMLADMKADMEERWASGVTKRVAHKMGPRQFDYYEDLGVTAGIKKLKPVVPKIMKACSRKYIFELDTYRQSRFKVVDDENFVKIA
ncbi:senecionine N-oxygenase-like isoform X2 [Eurosta solidaginis]|uniref:senecionine N-oxygenase-like isoform X2 n=1 Tax=Eurosta solidaginis TaxID=178769 RepID=UPI003530950D